MTTIRSYNKVKTVEEALKELYSSSLPKTINNHTYQQLDYHLVQKFIQIILNHSEIINEIEKSNREIINFGNKKK